MGTAMAPRLTKCRHHGPKLFSNSLVQLRCHLINHDDGNVEPFGELLAGVGDVEQEAGSDAHVGVLTEVESNGVDDN